MIFIIIVIFLSGIVLKFNIVIIVFLRIFKYFEFNGNGHHSIILSQYDYHNASNSSVYSMYGYILKSAGQKV